MKRIAIGLAIFATMMVLMAFFERSLIFFHTRYPDGFWDTEAVARGLGCVVEDRFFEAADEVRLHGWWVRRVDSKADRVVPFALGWKLFEAASEPKRFYEVVGAGHNETSLVGGEGYFEALREFVEQCQVPRS